MLYDMSGNLWEWVHDTYTYSLTGLSSDPVVDSSGSKVIRGGFSNSSIDTLRSAKRDDLNGINRVSNTGFRVTQSQ